MDEPLRTPDMGFYPQHPGYDSFDLDLFDPTGIDWGSDSDAEARAYSSMLLNETLAIQTRATNLSAEITQDVTWDDLSSGAKWIVIKILCNDGVSPDNSKKKDKHNRCFAEVVTTKLYLTRYQIQSFLIVYMHDFEVWQTWEDQTTIIDWPRLLECAASVNRPVMDLLPKGRPQLSTDAISMEEMNKAAKFLRCRHFEQFADQAHEWVGLNVYGDFLGLAVESEILGDYLDGELLRKAASLGWISLKKIRTNLRESRKREGRDPNIPPGGFFMGAGVEGDAEALGFFPDKLDAMQTSSGNCQANSSTQKDTPTNRRRNKKVAAVPCPPRRPTQVEVGEVRAAVDRQILDPYKSMYCPGETVSTLIEKGRPPEPEYQLPPKISPANDAVQLEQSALDTLRLSDVVEEAVSLRRKRHTGSGNVEPKTQRPVREAFRVNHSELIAKRSQLGSHPSDARHAIPSRRSSLNIVHNSDSLQAEVPGFAVALQIPQTTALANDGGVQSSLEGMKRSQGACAHLQALSYVSLYG